MSTVTHITDQDFPIFATGDQTISGEKVFTIRPSVSGNLFLISGDPIEATLIRKHSDVFEAHANDIEGFFIAKTFNYSDGCIGIEFYHPDGTRLGYSILGNRYGDGFVQSLSNTFRIEKIFGDLAYLQSAGLKDGFGRIFSLPSKEGILALLSDISGINIPSKFVYVTGNQTISGIKNFASRPTVNGTGILLNGEVASLPNTIVYTTGEQLISGLKNFNIRPRVNGTGVLLSGEAYLINNLSGFITSKNVVFTTGDQTISGHKIFNSQGTYFAGVHNGTIIISDDLFGGELGLITNNDEVIAVKMSNGSFQYGGGVPGLAPISVLNGNIIILNTGGNTVYDNPFLTINNNSNGIRFGIPPQNPFGPPPLDDAGIIFDGNGGNEYVLEFLNGAGNSNGGKITFNNTGYLVYQQELLNFYTKDNPSGFITGLDTSNFYTKNNPSGFIGNYNYKANINYYNKYSWQQNVINAQELNSPLSGIKNGDIVNLYFSDPTLPVDNGVRTTYSKTLKVNPGVLVDHNGAISSRNLIKFDDTTQYSGKAIRKVRYNSTVGNGYERINLTNLSSGENPATIRPLTRRLETFYDISVPSGGGVRALYFNRPTSPNFVQGLCMNLRFNFEADSDPCVISGYSAGGLVFLLTGANYNFVQKERVILINKGVPPYYEFKHW